MDTEKGSRIDVPTVSRVAGDTIVELVYDSEKRETGLVVSRFGGLWNIERDVTIAGERLVPYSPRNNLIAHNCVLLASKPEEFGTKDELIADIRQFLHRYVDLTPAFERIAAHYVVLTWVYDAFSEIPYLRLRGPYGSGKTRGLIAIGSICYKPFFAAGASTVSPIFHTLDRFGATLVLDEADFRFSDATADLVKVFNNGTTKGLPVLRTVQNRNREFNPAAFNVFGPKIIAMRGAFQDDALESRFLTEETGMHTMRADVPLHLPESFHKEALALRNRLLHFRLCTLFSTKPKPDRASAELDARLNQITLPLLSLVEDPELRASIQASVRDAHARVLRNCRETIAGRVLAAALSAFAISPGKPVSVQAVADAFNRTQAASGREIFTARRVGGVLKSAFNVETRKSHGTFVLSGVERAELEKFAARYGLMATSKPE